MHLLSRFSASPLADWGRTLSGGLAAVLLAGLLAGSTMHRAEATTLAELTVDQMTDASDLIVRGEVESTWTGLDDRGHVYSYATLRITETLKGSADVDDYVTVETPGGVLDGRVVDVPMAARYSAGEEVLVFLNEKRHGTAYGSVGMFQGKYTIKPNPTDGADMVVRFTVPWEREFDARFVPNPPKDQRVSFQRMEDTVRARVALGWDGKSIPGVSVERLRTINRLQPGVR